MPLLIYFLWAPRHAPPIIVDTGTLAIALLVIYKHDGNLQRLVEGTEPRFFLWEKEGNGMTKIAILGGGQLGHGAGNRSFRGATSLTKFRFGVRKRGTGRIDSPASAKNKMYLPGAKIARKHSR